MRKLLLILLAVIFVFAGCGKEKESTVQIPENGQIQQSMTRPEERLTEHCTEITGDISQPGTMAIMCSEGYWRTWRVETVDQNGEVKEYRYETESMLPQDAELTAVPITVMFNGNMLKVEGEAVSMESPMQLMLNIEDGKEVTFSVVHDNGEETFTVRSANKEE